MMPDEEGGFFEQDSICTALLEKLKMNLTMHNIRDIVSFKRILNGVGLNDFSNVFVSCFAFSSCAGK